MESVLSLYPVTLGSMPMVAGVCRQLCLGSACLRPVLSGTEAGVGSSSECPFFPLVVTFGISYAQLAIGR